ncbi:hypothetical protein TSAR_004255, partial [Trichomalopsis sarcophagae]
VITKIEQLIRRSTKTRRYYHRVQQFLRISSAFFVGVRRKQPILRVMTRQKYHADSRENKHDHKITFTDCRKSQHGDLLNNRFLCKSAHETDSTMK